MDKLTPDNFNPQVADALTRYFDRLNALFGIISNSASDRTDRFRSLNNTQLLSLEKEYYNYKLEELVRKPYERKKILVYRNSLVQNTDPVYLDPYKKGFLSFRTHFFAPSKYIFGILTDTFTFNIALVLLSAIPLYLFLFFDVLGKFVRFFEGLKFKK